MIKRAKRVILGVYNTVKCNALVGFILEFGQWGSNGPPSVILGGFFSRKGVPQKVFKLTGTDCSMRKGTFIDALPSFWNILGNWKGLGTNYRRIPDVCLVKKWLKRSWDSKRLWKFKLSLYTAVKSVLLSVMFSNTIFQKIVPTLGLFFFCAPFDAAT